MGTGSGREKSFGTKEESTATTVQRAKQRDSRTEDQCWQAHKSEMLVCSPTGAGGGWELMLKLQKSNPRERTGVRCMKRA